MEFEQVLPRRALGNGRWDKVLKIRMTDLSIADNYNDAKHEWIVTGETWYIPFGEEAEEVLPIIHHNHTHECLCGHPIVWHFEIENTENGNKEIVGSEHIESYMVIRHLEKQGIDPETITEKMIDDWVSERIKSLKAAWWWELHGEQFEEWFADIADLDLRVNVRTHGNFYDSETRRYEPTTVIRKKASGKFGETGYKMASIVWRWNHQDNVRNQRDGRGYPNERLWNDLQIFYIMLQQHKENIEREDANRRTRLEDLAKTRLKEKEAQAKSKIEYEKRLLERKIRLENEKINEAQLDGAREQKRLNRAIAARINTEGQNETFISACEYYDIPIFTPQMAENNWEQGFITDMIKIMSSGREISQRQLERLRNIVVDEPLPATDRQIWYIKKLGGECPENLTRTEASELITELKGGE